MVAALCEARSTQVVGVKSTQKQVDRYAGGCGRINEWRQWWNDSRDSRTHGHHYFLAVEDVIFFACCPGAATAVHNASDCYAESFT
jgi:hypothetical protein